MEPFHGDALEWDPRKAASNRRIHRVSFDEAVEAFTDSRAMVRFDPDHSHGEDRWILTGRTLRDRVLTVVFTMRRGRIRLISARRATKRESDEYGNGI
jgi:uncharacterized protein